MSTSANRRFRRSQERLQKKINEQFFKRIEGKTGEEIHQIMEQIRVKYNLDQVVKPQLVDESNI